MQGIFQKENTDKVLKYGIYRHLPTYEKIIRNLVSFCNTHSPILLGIPDADIYCFDNGSIHLCEYEETESYQITEMFINNRQMLLNRLLTD